MRISYWSSDVCSSDLYLLKPRPRQHVDGLLMTRYLRAVRWCLEHPRKTVASASAFFLVSLLMIHQLPLTFLASSDASTEVAVIDGPPGSSLENGRESGRERG